MNFVFLLTIILHISAHQCVSVRNREKEKEVITTKRQPGLPAGWTAPGNDPGGDSTCCSTHHCDVAYRCWEFGAAKCCWPPENDDECGRPGLPYGWSAPGNDPASDAICRSSQHCEAAYRCWNGPSPRCCWPPENDAECGIPGVPYGWSVPGNDPAGDVACRSSQHCEAAFRCWDGLQAKCCWPPENHNQCDRPGLPNGWTAPGNDPAGDATCRSQYNCEGAFRCWNVFIAHCCWPDEYDDECIEGCFPSSVKLKLEDGRSVAMSELQVGDRVQTVSEEGKLMYSNIRAILHKDDATIGLYVKIRTAANNTISLSATHLIYAAKKSNDNFSPMYAYDVTAADHVLIQQDEELVPEKVIDVSTIALQGVYAPLTANGNIIVEGVLASCYASFDHDLAHFAMTPMQWYPEIIRWIFGVNKITPGYVSIAKEVGRWILAQL